MSSNPEESSVESQPKANGATILEMGLPENPEIVSDSSVELSQEDKSPTEELTQSSDVVTEETNEKPEVHFAQGHTSFVYEPEEEEDTLSMVSVLLEEFTGHFFARLPRILSNEELPPVEFRDKFTQTFFKAMTKVSNRRFLDIINMQVDHADNNLVFFCQSYELLSTFTENDENSVN